MKENASWLPIILSEFLLDILQLMSFNNKN